MMSTRDLEPFNSKLHIVLTVLQHLNASFAHVVFHPRITVEPIALFTRMPNFYMKETKNISTIQVQSRRLIILTSKGRVVLRAPPHEAGHERLR